jgi:hypothetical protein
LFTLKGNIVLSLITLYLFIQAFFPLETINSDPSNGGNLTENHTIPMVAEIHSKQSIKEEYSSLFMNSILWKGKKRRYK